MSSDDWHRIPKVEVGLRERAVHPPQPHRGRVTDVDTPPPKTPQLDGTRMSLFRKKGLRVRDDMVVAAAPFNDAVADLGAVDTTLRAGTDDLAPGELAHEQALKTVRLVSFPPLRTCASLSILRWEMKGCLTS
jgi:hypothetical protein